MEYDSDEMTEQVNSAEEVIDRLGGPTAVANAIGNVSPKAVSMWKSRGLPAWSFLAVSTLLKNNGLTAPPSLWRMREAARR